MADKQSILNALLSIGGNSEMDTSTDSASRMDILSALGSIGNNSGSLGGSNVSWYNNSDLMNNIGTGVDALSGLFNIYSGVRGLNQAKDSFNFNKNLASTNLANQANLINEQLSTRQATRLKSQGLSEADVAKGVSDFMAKYGVSGTIGG